MFKKPGVYKKITFSFLSLVAVLFFINAFNLPGSVFIRHAMAALTTGTGTINYLPRFAGADATSNSLSDSIIFDDSAGHIGIGTTNPTNVVTVQQSGNSTAATATTYGLAVNIAGSQQLTAGADATYAYLQSWNSKPLYINSQGNNTIFGAGNVGIGITNPAFGKLQILQSADTNVGGITISNSTQGNSARIYMDAAATNVFHIDGNSTGAVAIALNGSGTGNVGIGTTGTSPGAARLMVVDTNKATDSGGILFVASSDAQAINKGGQITLGGGYTDAGAVQYFASIAGRKADGVTGNLNGYLALATAAAGTQIERMRIGQNGNVGIGTTAPNSILDIQQSTATLTVNIKNTIGSGQGDIVLALDKAATGNSNFVSYRTGGVEKWELGTGIASIDDNFRLRTPGGASVITAEFTGAVNNTLYLKSGNVGIGTTTPLAKLQVVGDGQFFKQYSATSGNYLYQVISNNVETGYMGMESDGTPVGVFTNSLAGALFLVNGAAKPLQLGTNSAANVTILSGGNVGIGTTTPGDKLVVSGGNIVIKGALPALVLNRSAAGGGYSDTIHFQTADITKFMIGLGTYAVDDTRLDIGTGAAVALTIKNDGNVGIGTTTPAYKLDVNGQVNASSFVGPLYARDVRTVAPNSEIATSLRFGFTSYANNNTPPYADYLQMRSYGDSSGGSDNLLMLSKGAIAMRIYQQAFGSATAFSTYSDVNLTPGSDIRLKKDVTTISNALEKTLQLRGVNFNWNDIYLKNFGSDENKNLQMGLIAQEVNQVVPEVVQHNKIGIQGMTDVLSIDYPRLTALSIEATKELNTKVDAQQKKIDELNAENVSLESRLSALEQKIK